MAKTPRVFYGWWLVLTTLFINAISAGAGIYFFSILAGEVQQAFSTSRASVMLALTLTGIMSSLLAPKLGELMDRFSIKWMTIGCAISMGVGFMVLSFSPSVWFFVGSYALLLPVGATVLSQLLQPLLLARWFHRRMGLAFGVAAVGSQTGGFLFPPIIVAVIEVTDWRTTLQIMGIFIALVVSLVSWWLIVDHPEDIGLHPDGDPEPSPEAAQAAARPARELSFGDIWRQRNFWLAGIAVGVIAAMLSSVLSNLALFATDIGVPREQAALLISLFAIMGIVFSPVFGRLSDLLDIRVVFVLMLSTNIVALATYFFASSFLGLIVATFIIGSAAGGFTPLWGAMVGRLFDRKLMGRVMGSMMLLTLPLSSGAPVLAGWIFDVTGNYRYLFLALIVVMLIPILYMPLIKPRQSSGTGENSG